MCQRSLFLSLAVILGLAAGCSSAAQPLAPPADGGPASDGGAASDGASDALVGSDAPATDAPAPPDGSDGPASTCTGDSAGPLAATAPPRRTLPWTLELPGDGGTAGSDDGGMSSSCTGDGPEFYRTVKCRGTALVRDAASAPSLELEDGSVFRFTALTDQVARPNLIEGERIWLDYEAVSVPTCALCGGKTTRRAMAIRESQGGSILFAGAESKRIDEALVQEVFGVSTSAVPVCTLAFEVMCDSVVRTVFDHVLATTPEQYVAHATVTRVATVEGVYDVFWTESSEAVTSEPTCLDGVPAASDQSFAVTRIERSDGPSDAGSEAE